MRVLKCVAPSVLTNNTRGAVRNLMKRHDAKMTLNSWSIQLKCAVDDGKEITKLSRLSKNWSIEEKTHDQPSTKRSYCYSVSRASFHYFFRNIMSSSKKNKENREGKKISDTQTEENPFSCSLDYELSLSSVQSVARVQKNKKNKKRVSRTYKVRNSFDKVSNGIEIKRLLEPARSFQGLSLNRFFGFVEYRYSLITYGIK